MYIYKITNLVNNKVYIGITNNYKKRWSNEKSKTSNQVISKAIYKRYPHLSTTSIRNVINYKTWKNID